LPAPRAGATTGRSRWPGFRGHALPAGQAGEEGRGAVIKTVIYLPETNNAGQPFLDSL
jgi:hypothetical protein